MNDGDREKLKRTFDKGAELYDKARPDYPEQIFDDLFALGGLGSDAAVLEVGCGTGKATKSLARRGCRVVGVELGENLAAVARRNLESFPRVEVVTASFELWEPRDSLFDMVFAASSWHWIDPEIRYRKAARILKPGGILAIVDHGHAFPEGFDPFFTEIQRCYEEIGEPHLEWPPPRPEEEPDRRAEIERSGLFEVVGVKRHVGAIDYTADAYIDVLNTYSGHIAWEQSKRDKLYAEVRSLIAQRADGRVRKHYLGILQVCRRR
ncbi:class I SAM-dependent methyltransferase [Candidatus Binatus sp.]|uniref:class I SAM-dependent methyltransferase n=1 Tax=Candidatus Binatus sp. TaxID=2811406 RepID=UPI003BB0FB5E